jgi:hypothetical protein
MVFDQNAFYILPSILLLVLKPKWITIVTMIYTISSQNWIIESDLKPSSLPVNWLYIMILFATNIVVIFELGFDYLWIQQKIIYGITDTFRISNKVSHQSYLKMPHNMEYHLDQFINLNCNELGPSHIYIPRLGVYWYLKAQMFLDLSVYFTNFWKLQPVVVIIPLCIRIGHKFPLHLVSNKKRLDITFTIIFK